MTWLCSAQQQPLLPTYWIENVLAEDGSTQSSLVFRTVPGVRYTVECSHNVTEWTELGSLYGLGHEFVTPMRLYTAPPPPPPGDPTPAPLNPVRIVSLRMAPATGEAGGTVVAWTSLENDDALMTFLPDSLDTNWAMLPFFAERYGSYYFFVSHPNVPIPPPLDNPELAPLDAAMIATLQSSLADMNQRVADSVARSRNSPPPAPPDPMARKFWRIKADWSKDSDSDGSPDWLEFSSADANPVVLVGLRADAFDADTNRDGVPDGSQLDSDSDGLADKFDPAPLDPAIATSASAPRWRYAVFPLPAAADSNGQEFAPHMINSQGKVLFPMSIWHRGAFKELEMERQGEIQGIFALSMNDSGQILGVGMAQRFEQSGGGSGQIVTPPMVNAWWDSDAAEPIIVEANGQFAKPAISAPPIDNPVQPPYPFDSLLANDTRFMANHTETKTVGGNTIQVGVRTLWRKAVDGFSFTDDERYSEDDYDIVFAGGTDYVWGWNGGGSRLLTTGAKRDFSYPVLRLPLMPAQPEHAAIPVAFGADRVPDGLVPMPAPQTGSTWQPLKNLAGGRDVSANGVRLVGNFRMAQDIRESEFRWWAADVPVELETPRFMNASDNGWVLARDSLSPKSLAAMPVLFEDDTEATGADSFSLGGTALPLQQGGQMKSWVMVPLGENASIFKLRSLASGANVLTLDAGDLLFGNGTGTTEVNEPVAMLSLRASSPNVSSGATVNLGLKLGAAECVSHPLAGYVMKARTVKVNVYKVVKQTPGKPDNPPDLMDTPEGEPNFETQLATYLTAIFKPQINATFQVNVVAAPLTLNWDGNGDEFLNLNADPDNQSAEQNLIINAGRLISAPISNIDVFILGTTQMIDGDAWGTTTVPERACWMVGDAVISTRTPAKLQADIAHEIGHVMVGPGHPDQGGGNASLPGTDHPRRLMCSGGNQGLNPGHLLVKAEWEKAEAWMKVNIDNPQQ